MKTRQELEGKVIQTKADLDEVLEYMDAHPLEGPLNVRVRAKMEGWHFTTLEVEDASVSLQGD